VAGGDLIKGDLQRDIMRVIWGVGGGSVEQVRARLSNPSAYTTVQTVLNRLAERGLLARERSGNSIKYTPLITEADYVAGSLNRALDGVSDEARHAALAALVGDLDAAELSEIRALARRASKARGR
jgi:predicted transcriptional regulator